MGKFTTFDVARILKMDRTRLQEWIDKKFITPETPAKGKGSKALFTKEQLYQIKLAVWLLKTGKQRSQAFYIANLAWYNVGTSPGQNKFLTVNQKVVSGELLEVGAESITSNYPTQQMGEDDVFRTSINLVAVIREVNLAIENDAG